MPGKRPLRVLHVTSTSVIGGAEQMILQMIRATDPARATYEVLSLIGPGHLTERVRAGGVRAENWALRRMTDPRLPFQMRHFLEIGHYDLVHTYGLRAELVTRWAARNLGLPLVSGLHSVDPWRRWYHVALDRVTAGGVTAWVAVCEAVRQSRIRREHFPADRIHVIYNGIPDAHPPDAHARAKARQQYGIAQTAPVLAVVANLREAKGYPDLFKAIGQLSSAHPNLTCLCAGRDDSAGAIPALAKQMGVGVHLRWLGFVDPADPVLAAADVSVIASHWEGCPVNLLEAMRAALPSVATRVGGIPEMIEHETSGLLVEPRQPEKLAEAIGRLLKSPAEAQQMGHAARWRFLKHFTLDRMAGRMLELYDSVAVQKRRS